MTIGCLKNGIFHVIKLTCFLTLPVLRSEFFYRNTTIPRHSQTLQKKERQQNYFVFNRDIKTRIHRQSNFLYIPKVRLECTKRAFIIMDVKFLIRCRVNLYLTNKLHFPVCVYCNRSHVTSQRAKNKKVRHETKSSGVDCCSLHAVTSYLIYYSTHTRENVIYLFYTIKIQMVY